MVHRNAFALAWPAAVWIIAPEPVAKCASRENGDEPLNAFTASDPRLRGDRPRPMGEAGGGDGRGVAPIVVALWRPAVPPASPGRSRVRRIQRLVRPVGAHRSHRLGLARRAGD